MSQATPQKIESLDQFAAIVTNWYQNNVARLTHVKDMPEDVGINIADSTGKVREEPLNADGREGFLAGITYALEVIGDLPFGFVADPAPTVEPQADAAEA